MQHPIYLYNIRIKHLQYTSETCETLETYACNIRFQYNVTCCLNEWTLVIAEINASVEVGNCA
jgi:hypothetical protein